MRATKIRLPFLIPFLLAVQSACSNGGRSRVDIVATPAAPENVQATALSGAATITWSPSTGAASYRLYFAASPDLTPANWDTLPEGHVVTSVLSPHLVTGLTNGTTYSFLLTAWNADGTRESAPSPTLQVTPMAGTAPGNTSPTTQPAVAVTSVGATLAGHLLNPVGYTTTVWFEHGPDLTYGAVTPTQHFAAAGDIDVTAIIDGLPPRTDHHFRLVTENSGGRFAGDDRSFRTLAEPQVLLGNLNAPLGLCSDGTHLFFYEVYSARVRRVHPTTGASLQLASVPGGGNSGAITVRDSHVFFANVNTVWRVGTDGTGLVAWWPFPEASELLAHTTGLYVRHEQTISWVSPNGSASTAFHVRTPTSTEGFGGRLAADANFLYWTDWFAGTVQRLGFAGGPVVTLALGQNHPNDLLIDGDTIWFETEDGLRTVPTTGGAVTPLCASHGGFTKQGDLLYAVNGAEAFVVEASTGATSLWAIGANAASRPVVTGQRMLWLRRGSQYDPPLGALVGIDL